MATYTSNYAWTKPSGGDPVDIEVLNDNLDDQDSIVHQAFLDLAPVFSTANTYAVKDVVLYDNKVWICHTAVTTAGAWTGSANWTQTTVGETGGVGTYADLPDKPSINGNELSGNKTGAQLGLQNTLTFDNVPTANSTNPVKSGGVYSADEAIRKWTTAEAKSASGNPITLTDGSARNAEGLVVTLEPKQSGSGTPSPENVRPITGYTECEVDRDGRNIWDEEWQTGYYSSSTGNYTSSNTQICSKNMIPVEPVTDYYFRIPNSTNGAIRCYDKDGTYLSYINRRNEVFTTPANCYYIHINGGDSYGAIYGDNICINKSNADFNGQYVPYQHAQATITFGQTVYGGSVDFKTGKVTVTHKLVDMGDLTWNYNSIRFSAEISDISLSASRFKGICDIYQTFNGTVANAPDHSIIFDISGYDYVYVKTSSYTDATAFKNAMVGHSICYELEVPVVLTLTPAELELLKGYNYITSNGTTIALAYLPDGLLAEAENYVDAKIPPAPSSDGTYVLTCTVTSGIPAYSWESAT